MGLSAIAILELMEKFGPFLADHIARFRNASKIVPSYLSLTLDECITQIVDQLRKKIINEIQRAKYVLIIVGSTSDISLRLYVIRYVFYDGIPVERFSSFIPNAGHDINSMSVYIP